jgi:hypothetical protein
MGSGFAEHDVKTPIGWVAVAVSLAGLAPSAAAAAPDPKAIAATIAMPSAQQIPPAALAPVIRQAVANGAVSILARILADGNGSGLAYPPVVGLKLVGYEEVPTRKVISEEAVYEHDWKNVEQLVPEMSGGVPTGRFVPGTVRVAVNSRKVGTRTAERLVPDPNGTEKMKWPKHEKSGPDRYVANLFGFNGMALYVLARSGLGEHAAVKGLAEALADRITEFGAPDLTFDVAWLAAGFAALGPDSPHADLARKLAGKLIDGQIREKGDVHGLWGPVCIHSAYAAKLVEFSEGLRRELEDVIPKRWEAAPPAERQAMYKQAKEMSKVRTEILHGLRFASPYAVRMLDITQPFPVMDQAVLPPLPYYIYNRTISDVESTATAAFALAEAARHGLVPKETSRVVIRGKKVQPPEKSEATIRVAAEKLAAYVGDDGGISSLVRQAVNTGFNKSKLSYHEVPFKGRHPPLFDVQSACSCVIGHAALEAFAGLNESAADVSAAARGRALRRATAIAERWYRETSPDFKQPWADVFAGFSVSKEQLTKSGELPLPEPSSPPVEELPWGGIATRYEIVPALLGVCGGLTGSAIVEQPLYRQIAYRLVTLQNGNGQWLGVSYDLLSSGRDSLGLVQMADSWHRQLNHVPQRVPPIVPTPYSWFLFEARPRMGSHAAVFDPGLYPTLASLVFLVASIDAPVDVTGIPLLPSSAPVSQATTGTPPATQLPPTVQAAMGVDRPNPLRAALSDAVLAAAGLLATDRPPAGKPERSAAGDEENDDASAGAKKSAEEPVDEDLGTLEDLIPGK